MTKEKRTTRDGFGEALVEAARKDPHIVALTADLRESMRLDGFAEQFPNRFFEIGVAEENMVGIAAGLALTGKTPVTCSYAVFNPQNTMGPIRSSVCYSKTNVKIIGGHAGISTGPDGATHQALEDIAMMRTLPNMIVVVPADYHEAKKATQAILDYHGPAYLRIGKYLTQPVSDENTEFKLGKATILREGNTVAIIACGTMVAEAIKAADQLETHNVSTEVLNMHTIKPIDRFSILELAGHVQLIVTIEEHQITGGLGSAVAEVLAELPQHPPLHRIGMLDQFGESGPSDALLKKYGLTADAIVDLALSKI
ncbi:MAG: transketolase family protein [Pseudomonadales bacterium]|nr:transketolase family protein [Candidatus Woesebacteria bacterium]MCB9800710.1 transketolase family protein [Pseudomonadales bacterium]